jgi:hypothetical protein
VFPFDKSIFRLRSWSDSLLSNNARDYQAGYKKPAKASKKEPGKNWRDKSAPAGASLADFED